jgi:hypothetical protein
MTVEYEYYTRVILGVGFELVFYANAFMGRARQLSRNLAFTATDSNASGG